MAKAASLKEIVGASIIVLSGVPVGFVLLLLLLVSILGDVSDFVFYLVIACLVAGAFVYLGTVSHRLMAAFLVVVAALLSWWGVDAWQHRNLLSKYGVSWDITCGEHAEFQTIWFHWDRNGKRINGPMIWGDNLCVEFKQDEKNQAPLIVVRSETDKREGITLRLNFSDPTKPEFETMGNKRGAEYPPPWSDFYKTDEKDEQR